tara:strand:+ start:732 stop:1037 length:306 start_codon:yes stop_codon:yes gene_type:complete
MTTTEELIDTLGKGDMVKAGQAFTDLMNAKVQDSLNDRKIELGQQLHLSPEEIEAMNDVEPDEDELEDETEEDSEEEIEDETEEELEEVDDEDIQSDSTES